MHAQNRGVVATMYVPEVRIGYTWVGLSIEMMATVTAECSAWATRAFRLCMIHFAQLADPAVITCHTSTDAGGKTHNSHHVHRKHALAQCGCRTVQQPQHPAELLQG